MQDLTQSITILDKAEEENMIEDMSKWEIMRVSCFDIFIAG